MISSTPKISYKPTDELDGTNFQYIIHNQTKELIFQYAFQDQTKEQIFNMHFKIKPNN